MYANKLKHNRPTFVVVRGIVAYLMLMGIWSFYPWIQRPDRSDPIKEDVRQEPVSIMVDKHHSTSLKSSELNMRTKAGLMIPMSEMLSGKSGAVYGPSPRMPDARTPEQNGTHLETEKEGGNARRQ